VRYRKKYDHSHEVFAEKFTPGTPITGVVEMQQTPTGPTVGAFWGVDGYCHFLVPGEYLLTEDDGSRYSMAPSLFKVIYERIVP